ncbi:MAG: hypothetical protein ACM359_06130, partial [Bacillota bacterium]
VGREAASYTVRLPIEPGALKRAGFMSEGHEVGGIYQQAITLYEQNREVLDRYDRIVKLESAEAEPWGRIMELLGEAARSSRRGVFEGAMGLVINYDVERPGLEAARTLGRAAIRLALLANVEGRKEAARRYAEAAFALGAKLYEERLTYAEFDVAQDLLGSAAPMLAKLATEAGEAEYAELITDFNRQRIEYWKARIQPVQQVVQVMEANAGDLLALAEKGGDAMWRVEAVLALGRCKYAAERGADQRAAKQMLDKLSGSGEPRIRLAAEAGRELTIVQYRKLR